MIPLETHLSDFTSYLRSERGLSANTVEAYGRDCSSFITSLKVVGIHDPHLVTGDHIIEFISQKKNQGYASASLCRMLISIKVFVQFLYREDVLDQDLGVFLETPKLWQTLPEVLSYNETELLLSQPDQTTAEGIRDRAIIELLYASGLRVSELCNLKLYDIDDEQIRVMGKGSKERLVPVGKMALQAVDLYLTHVRSHFESERETKLFLTDKGKPIDRHFVFKMIKEYAKQAQIEKNISPHTLRHSFASHLLSNGADLRVIQEMLGHAHISSTDRYTHLIGNHIQEAFHSFHPRWNDTD